MTSWFISINFYFETKQTIYYSTSSEKFITGPEVDLGSPGYTELLIEPSGTRNLWSG